MPTIDDFTGRPLHLELSYKAAPLGSGTGFTVLKNGLRFLVTNWHVVSGRHPETKKAMSPTAAVPDSLRVWHHQSGSLGSWIPVDYPLATASGTRSWREAALPNGHMLDVVTLPISPLGQVAYYDLDLALASADVVVAPSEPVSIIGFPFGRSSAGKFPIWKTGHIASDVDLDFDGKPIFLVDAATKPGMSGSPVVAKRVGIVTTASGMSIGSNGVRFMGVYSGRTQDDDELSKSNLGLVWKPSVLNQLLP